MDKPKDTQISKDEIIAQYNKKPSPYQDDAVSDRVNENVDLTINNHDYTGKRIISSIRGDKSEV